jgi:poly(3-hydroxybutyrate) depolymerase
MSGTSWRRVVAVWTVFVLTLAATSAKAQSRPHAPAPRILLHDTPCPGCLASVPEGSDPVPLIVALHGDGEGAAPVHDAWEKLAAPRRVAVLAIACPKQLGCEGSFWRWNGAPTWIDAQVTKLAERRPIARDRLWLVAWSGGASYVGYRTQELERTFAAIVIHGGGIPPAESSCGENKASVYFLVGDRNPLHALTAGLRDHYVQCGSDVAWDLLRGAEHGGEWQALGSHGIAILDWLATKRRL